MPICKICMKFVSDGIHLSDGGMIHESCLESIQTEVFEIESELHQKQRILDRLIHEIERRNGLVFRLMSIFAKPNSDISDIEKEVAVVRNRMKKLSMSLFSLENKAGRIYDLFLAYPPDWDERKKQVAKRDGDKCSMCGNWKNLHLHHIKPLSKGGNNNIINLRILCENCHSKEHGGRGFSGEFKKTETAFSKRVANIRYAIENSRRIKFGYKKPTDKGYKQRTVKPMELIDIAHVRDSGSTLCVLGHCELRNAERRFALKRMRGLKIL